MSGTRGRNGAASGNLGDLSEKDDVEDAGVEIEDMEVKECVEPPLVEREDDEDDNDNSEEPEPCRETGRSGTGLREGFGSRGREVWRGGVSKYDVEFDMIEMPEMVDEDEVDRCERATSVGTVSSRR